MKFHITSSSRHPCACTMPAMPAMLVLRLLCLYYDNSACTMPIMPILCLLCLLWLFITTAIDYLNYHLKKYSYNALVFLTGQITAIKHYSNLHALSFFHRQFNMTAAIRTLVVTQMSHTPFCALF